MVPLQTYFKIAPLHRRLHVVALVSLTVTLAFMILLSVSNIANTTRPFLGLGRAGFNGAAPTKLVDGKSGQTVAEDLRYINYGLWYYCWEVQQNLDVSCIKSGLGYSHTILRTDEFPIAFTVTSAWTRSFVLHPIAAVVTFLTLLLTLHLRIAFKRYTLAMATLSLVMVLATLSVDIAFGVVTSENFRANASLNGFFFFDIGFWLMIVPTFFSVVTWVVISVGHWKKRYVKVVEFVDTDYHMSPDLAANLRSSSVPWWRRFNWAGTETASGIRPQTAPTVGQQPVQASG